MKMTDTSPNAWRPNGFEMEKKKESIGDATRNEIDRRGRPTELDRDRNARRKKRRRSPVANGMLFSFPLLEINTFHKSQ